MAARKYKVALIQTQIEALEVVRNYAKAESYIMQAAKGAHLAVLPEYHLTGWEPDRPEFKSACSTWKEHLEKYQRLAKELDICIVPGTMIKECEAAVEGMPKTFQNIAYFLDNEGKVIGQYQKKNVWCVSQR